MQWSSPNPADSMEQEPETGVQYGGRQSKPIVAELAKAKQPWKPVKEGRGLTRDALLKRKATGILNKLTPQTFEELLPDFMDIGRISDGQRCAWNEAETRVLIAVIFDKTVLEPQYCPIYAEVCKRVVDRQLNSSADKKSKFRDVLLTTCQDFFENNKAAERLANKLALTKDEKERKKLQYEIRLRLNKVKQRMIGNIRFIGELFKMGLMVSVMMHYCVMFLFKDGSDEESVECLCKLLQTVGQFWEKQSPTKDNFHQQIPAYYEKLAIMAEVKEGSATVKGSAKFSSRLRFIVKDLLEQRKSGWRIRRLEAGPKTIKEVHLDYQLELIQKQKDSQKLSNQIPKNRLR